MPLVYPKKWYQGVAEGPDDDAIIDCVVEAKADVVVSGDGHLSELGQIEEIAVVTPATFIETIEQADARV